MKTELYLQIPKPCHENWDTMTPVDKGRFCASCSKEVIDFSLLSDAEVLNFFKRSTSNTCGRFNEDQLQRPLQATKIEKKKGWKWAMASITSLIMISKSNAQKKEDCTQLLGKVKIEQPKKPVKAKGFIVPRIVVDTVIMPSPTKKKNIEDDWRKGEVEVIASGRPITINGYVFDEHNNPITGAQVSNGIEFINKYTDAKGHFELTTKTTANELTLAVKSFGFLDESSVIDMREDKLEVTIYMKPKVQVLPEVIVTSYATRRLMGRMGSVLLV